MARKSKRPRRSPAATPTRGGSDRDKAIDALMSLLADHSFEQVALAEVAGRAGIKLSQLRAEFGSTLAIFWSRWRKRVVRFSSSLKTSTVKRWPRWLSTTSAAS